MPIRLTFAFPKSIKLHVNEAVLFSAGASAIGAAVYASRRQSSFFTEVNYEQHYIF